MIDSVANLKRQQKNHKLKIQLQPCCLLQGESLKPFSPQVENPFPRKIHLSSEMVLKTVRKINYHQITHHSARPNQEIPDESPT
jgi:hypothetical protein